MKHSIHTFSTNSPFDGEIPPTISLRDTPLTSALVQIRFPEILSITKAEYVADFQERIRADYPLIKRELHFDLQQMYNRATQNGLPNWRFFDTKTQWRVSLTTDFIALDTRAYTSRQDFIKRIGSIAHALTETINPRIMNRIGVRYIDRIHGA